MGVWENDLGDQFQCSSASRKFLQREFLNVHRTRVRQFQCSSASRKFLPPPRHAAAQRSRSFSALQRAENSSPSDKSAAMRCSIGFSALQRAENSSPSTGRVGHLTRFGFSALQRAENSSPHGVMQVYPPPPAFQCSSASRKFLTWVEIVHIAPVRAVSVLFSEPKIPHCARKTREVRGSRPFQCSSASRKFLTTVLLVLMLLLMRFSALQRAENSSLSVCAALVVEREMFQCSSASRKFLTQ